MIISSSKVYTTAKFLDLTRLGFDSGLDAGFDSAFGTGFDSGTVTAVVVAAIVVSAASLSCS